MIGINKLVDRLIKKLAVYNMSYTEALNILGITGDASDEEAKSAFKGKVLEFHPDRHQDRDTTEEMKKVNRAYEVFKNRPDIEGVDWDHWEDDWAYTSHDHYGEEEEEEEEEEERKGPRDEIDDLLDSATRAGSVGNFPGFTFGEYYVSVQGSDHNYSIPPYRNLDKLSKYTHLEMGIFKSSGGGLLPLYKRNEDDEDAWSDLNPEYKDLHDMPGISYWRSDMSVGPYVPIAIVKDIIRYFDKKAGTGVVQEIEVGDTVSVTLSSGRPIGEGVVKKIYEDGVGDDVSYSTMYVVAIKPTRLHTAGGSGTYFAKEVTLVSKPKKIESLLKRWKKIIKA